MLSRGSLFVWILLVVAWGGFMQPVYGQRPNIIVILCDDLGYGDLECYGHPHIKTPNLNALASSGIRLTDCYSAAPVCSPSRVGLLTGRNPNRAGVYDWIPPAARPQPDARDLVHLRAEEVTIAKLLRDAGYATCMSGKWHCNSRFNSPEQPQPSDAGFEHWFGTQNNAAPSHENPKNYVRNGDEVGPLEGFSCQLATTEAIGWLQQHVSTDAKRPFVLYLAFHEPHEPVASPSELVDEYSAVSQSEDEAQFFANVANVDRAVGRLLAALEETGQRENTLIVFTSDNGPETLNRYRTANRSFGRPTPLRGMKLWTTDAGFRVAGIINWPAKIRVGRVSNQVVSSLDFLPTFAKLAGTQPPTDLHLDGTDFSALLEGQEIRRDQPLLWCYYNAINERRVAMRLGPWKMLARLGDDLPKLSNVFEGNRDRVQAAGLTDFQLFHIARDIGESENVMDTEPMAAELKQQMEAAYEELMQGSHVWVR